MVGPSRSSLVWLPSKGKASSAILLPYPTCGPFVYLQSTEVARAIGVHFSDIDGQTCRHPYSPCSKQ